MKYISSYLFSLNRYLKRFIAIIVDINVSLISLWFAFYFVQQKFILLSEINITLILLVFLLPIPIFWVLKIYKTFYRFGVFPIISHITIACTLYGILFFLIVSVFGMKEVPRSIGFFQPLLFYGGAIFIRFIGKLILVGSLNSVDDIRNFDNILIYGAGEAGRKLFHSLERNSKFKVVGFLDDDQQKQKLYYYDKKIYDPNNLKDIKYQKKIKLVLLAIPSLNKVKKNEITQNISRCNIQTKTLPNLSDIIEGEISFSDVKDYLIEDLLEREPVEANQQLLSKNITSKNVLITGAGGTIGGEILRQILKLKPKKLILFEINELALFNIYEEIINQHNGLVIIPLLGNILDQKKLETVFKTLKVDTVYHAAAYKHVPLVESNICEGVLNNVLGTLSVVKAVINEKVKNLVFISSDKAVRPTNIMGASKRFAELCLQVHKDKSSITNFSIVRFGNVLASSGSVVPKFKKQIMDGGPVTLTHNDVTRYFMTVPEAAQLVIQAGALGQNAEVFVLDMGASIKIKDMIIKMINLSGQKLKDKNNLDGDIEIKVIGLRPGEKLHEELLIGDNPERTIHPKITKIQEPSISFEQFERNINELITHLDNQDPKQVKNLLDRVIRFYNSNSELVDYIYNEQKDLNETSSNNDDKLMSLN